MANGSFTKQVGNRTNIDNEYITVWWSSVPDQASNTSKVRVYAKMYRPWYLYVDYNQDIELWIDGTKYTAKRYGWRGKGWTEAYIDKTKTVTHNADGKKSIKIRLRTQVKAWLKSYVGWVDTGEKTIKLDNIIRNSSFSLSNTTVTLGDSIKVNLSRSSSAVRHNITLNIGTKTETILSKENDNGSTASYSYTLDPSIFLPYMTGQSTTAKITVTTMSGSTAIGSVSQTFTVNIRNTDKPVLTDSMVSINAVPVSPNTNTDYYLQGKTKARITISPTASPGSTIKRYNVTVNGVLVNDIAYKESSAIILTDVLTLTGSNKIKISVVDSRGMTSDIITKDILVEPYTSPILTNFSVSRCLQDGTINKAGTYIKITADYSMASCNGGNTATITLKEKSEIGSEAYTDKKTWNIAAGTTTGSIDEVLGTYPAETSYNFALVITDSMNNTYTVYADIGTEEMLIDLAPNAVGIGKVVERENALEVEWPAYFENIIYGTVQANTSDARLKVIVDDDMEPLLNIWDSLNYILYKYRDGDDKTQLGIVAQEVIDLFEANNLDWEKYGIVYKDSSSGYYSINYEFINQLTTIKLKLLQMRVFILEEKMDKFEEKII